MSTITLKSLPSGISAERLAGLLNEAHKRETVLRAVIERFERGYDGSLGDLEARLGRGEGLEHPDWEDSIEWRNAVEALERTRVMRSLLEWLLPSIPPSVAS